jgi:uroporphyrin-III C-methyltransferase/precorrin-2 dehydrogenase/sirohydrochlorin ferrochelatase
VPPPLFPLFLKLDDRRCLVVGAGPVGESKVAGLLEAGAVVRVVSPSATDVLRRWADEGRVEWLPRRFEPSDLDDVRLVVAAIPDGEDLARVAGEAKRRGVLCNAVDVPERCDFYYPAVVRRGDLQIAISTGGHSPALAQRLRQELAVEFGAEYAPWVAELGRVRQALMQAGMDVAERRRLLHDLASAAAFARFRHTPHSASGIPRPESRIPDPESRTAGSRSPLPGGKVFLVGAGPGDPELLTLQALRVLGTADVVLHDDLVPAEVLELASPGALVQSVGKRHGEAHITQDGIHALMVDHARAGRTVVRLKGGDVAVFGRANEEIDALRAAGLPFEVVPGVTAVSSAAAVAGVSLTDRRTTSAVTLVTAQTCRGNARPDWRALVASGATLAIYMPGQRYERIAADLAAAGLDAGTPCLIVSRASQPGEAVTATTVGALAAAARLEAPAILVVGEVLRPDGAALRRGRPDAAHRDPL